MSRIAVTGIGAVTPIGLTAAEFWQNLVSGVSGVGPITHFDATGYPCRIAAEVKGFDPTCYMDAKAARRMSRFAQFAVAAARMALEDASLVVDEGNAESVGIVINTGGGGMVDMSTGTEALLTKGPDRVSPLMIPNLAPNMASCQVSIQLGIRGPVITSAAACAAGIYAFIEGQWLLERGEAEMVLAGGAESGIIPAAIASLCNARALSTRNDDPQRACRPFDRHRDGFVFGEGAGVMVLERYEHAQARGARIYAELAGGGLSADAYHITAPEPSGHSAARAMCKALKSTGLEPGDVDYICAHGTGTPLNDSSETRSIKQALGEHAYKVAISSPKSMVGHLLGAAGAVSAIASVLAIRDGIVPPTINLETPDPECDLDYVPNAARKARVRVAMANGFGFGGQNGVVVFKEWQP
ncbi:MAG: beta-ketoacyl-ACP synthase II [Dehalococcoidia bacterium]